VVFGSPGADVSADALGCDREHEEAGGNPAQSRYCDTASSSTGSAVESDPRARFHPINQGRSYP